MNADTIIKENQGARYPFLYYQVGRMETRPEQVPCYEGKHVVGHRVGNSFVSFFNLLGFGTTLARAEAMAKVSDENVPQGEFADGQ